MAERRTQACAFRMLAPARCAEAQQGLRADPTLPGHRLVCHGLVFFAAHSLPWESGVAACRRVTIASLGMANLHDRKDSPPFHATAC